MIKQSNRLVVGLLISLVAVACGSKKNDSAPYIYTPTAPVDKGWSFETSPSWSDEFNYTGAPDSQKWGYDLGGSGWGNNELENYTNSTRNANVANGVLTITAIKETSGSRNYSSARLQSANKFDFLYGRVEVKAQLPPGRGTWPAIWMLPTDYEYGTWPNSGEFDIMEEVGYDSNVIHVSEHTQKYNGALGNNKTNAIAVSTATTDYHLYRVDWTPYSIKGYVDDQLILEYVNDGSGAPEWPFDKKFHMLFNIAVGGNWGGIKGVDDAIFPVSMKIDYIRYYKMIDK